MHSTKPLHRSCIYQCKDTNFKANHNRVLKKWKEDEVVFTNAKILILKLITTDKTLSNEEFKLYLPMQRY